MKRRPAPVSGVIVVDKPEGITSFDVVARIRRLYGTTEVGHTGTLDPLATGVLPILIGRAVKASDYITAESKRYTATLRLGLTTDTEDVTGTVLTRSSGIPEEAAVQAAVRSLIGPGMQVPPMYSALKVDGRKLCDLARAGVEVQRTARPIEVYSLSAERLSETDYRLVCHVSKGTYIRTLCADVGRALGCGGVMATLRRDAGGPFTLADCVTLDGLSAMTEEERLALPRPVESFFDGCPAVTLIPFFEKLFRAGCPIYQRKIGTAIPDGTLVRVYSQGAGGRFAALGRAGTFEEGPAVKLEKLFLLED